MQKLAAMTATLHSYTFRVGKDKLFRVTAECLDGAERIVQLLFPSTWTAITLFSVE